MLHLAISFHIILTLYKPVLLNQLNENLQKLFQVLLLWSVVQSAKQINANPKHINIWAPISML